MRRAAAAAPVAPSERDGVGRRVPAEHARDDHGAARRHAGVSRHGARADGGRSRAVRDRARDRRSPRSSRLRAARAAPRACRAGQARSAAARDLDRQRAHRLSGRHARHRSRSRGRSQHRLDQADRDHRRARAAPRAAASTAAAAMPTRSSKSSRRARRCARSSRGSSSAWRKPAPERRAAPRRSVVPRRRARRRSRPSRRLRLAATVRRYIGSRVIAAPAPDQRPLDVRRPAASRSPRTAARVAATWLARLAAEGAIVTDDGRRAIDGYVDLGVARRRRVACARMFERVRDAALGGAARSSSSRRAHGDLGRARPGAGGPAGLVKTFAAEFPQLARARRRSRPRRAPPTPPRCSTRELHAGDAPRRDRLRRRRALARSSSCPPRFRLGGRAAARRDLGRARHRRRARHHRAGRDRARAALPAARSSSSAARRCRPRGSDARGGARRAAAAQRCSPKLGAHCPR